MSLMNLCRSTADIQRPTWATDDLGGVYASSWATPYSGIPVLIQPASGRVVEEFSKRSMVISHVAYTPTAISIQTGDRLYSGSVYYEIVDWGDMAGQGRAYRMGLLRKD